MSNKFITTHYICEKCEKKYEFSDNKNKSGIRYYSCKHFSLKFIRNTDEQDLKYYLCIKCSKCSRQKKQNLIINNNYNKNTNNLNYSFYNCCQNAINIATFFSDEENQSII